MNSSTSHATAQRPMLGCYGYIHFMSHRTQVMKACERVLADVVDTATQVSVFSKSKRDVMQRMKRIQGSSYLQGKCRQAKLQD